MGWLDDLCNSVSNAASSTDEFLFGGPGECGGLIGGATNKIIDSISNGADAVYATANEAVDKFNEDRVGAVLDTAAVIAVTVASGAVAPTIAGFAPKIAAIIGSSGLLGTTATTGMQISGLSGAALASASSAQLGGGALAVGGGGMVAGNAAITAVGTTITQVSTGAVTAQALTGR